MKISITLSLDVDPEVWDENYRTGTAPQAIREDVRSYVLNWVQNAQAADAGAIVSATVRDGA